MEDKNNNILETNTINIYESSINVNKKENNNNQDEKTENSNSKKQKTENKMLNLVEFVSIVKDFDQTITTIDETIKNLDYTLSDKEPKKGRWLLESGEDIDFLDNLAMQETHDNRARGRHAWNQALDNIINKYAPELNNESDEDFYNALRIMDESYKFN